MHIPLNSYEYGNYPEIIQQPTSTIYFSMSATEDLNLDVVF